jgi:hypothetical protein
VSKNLNTDDLVHSQFDVLKPQVKPHFSDEKPGQGNDAGRLEMQQRTQVSLIIEYVEVPALGKALNQVHVKGTHVILGWLHKKQFQSMLELLCAVESRI